MCQCIHSYIWYSVCYLKLSEPSFQSYNWASSYQELENGLILIKLISHNKEFLIHTFHFTMHMVIWIFYTVRWFGTHHALKVILQFVIKRPPKHLESLHNIKNQIIPYNTTFHSSILCSFNQINRLRNKIWETTLIHVHLYLIPRLWITSKND